MDMLLVYAGSQARQEDLFQNKSVLAMAKNTLERSIKGVENVSDQRRVAVVVSLSASSELARPRGRYTQHKSLLSQTVDALMKLDLAAGVDVEIKLQS